MILPIVFFPNWCREHIFLEGAQGRGVRWLAREMVLVNVSCILGNFILLLYVPKVAHTEDQEGGLCQGFLSMTIQASRTW